MNIINKHSTYFILTLIVILSLVVNTYKLSEFPPGFFADEAAIGLNAYTLLKNGTDEYGTRFPLFFRSFNDYKSPVAFYTAIPFVYFFGLNEFSVRFTSAIFGVLNVLIIFFLVRLMLTGYHYNNAAALTSSFFLAISPWHIHMSRIGWEALTQMLFFTLLGLYLFLRAQRNAKLLPASVSVFAVATYCYFPARAFVPILGLGLFLMYFRFFCKHKKETAISIAILLILLLPLMHHVFTPEGTARWNMVSIFSNPPKDVPITDHIINNYLTHFSFDFLFKKGDIGMPGKGHDRHSVKGLGELYLFQLPFIFIGAYFLWNIKYRKIFSILALWIFLYPIGSVFTIALSAQATRSFFGVIPFQILAAIGLWAFFDFVSQKSKVFCWILAIIFGILVVFSFSSYLKAYYIEYPEYATGFYGWQYGARDIVNYFLSVESEYDDLIMGPDFNAPDIFLRFYSQDFEKGCKKCRVGRFEKYDPKKKQLFAQTPYELGRTEYNSTFSTKKTVYYPDGKVAFLIGEVIHNNTSLPIETNST